MNWRSNRTEESENFGETIKETLTNIDMKIADTSTQNIGVLDEVAWTYKNGKQKPVEIKAKLGKNQLGLPDVMFDGKIPVYSIPSGVFITASLRSPGGQDIITRFSNIVRAGQKQELMQYLTMVEPTLSDLELLTTGAKIGIWAFKNNGTKLPVELLGDGFGRVLSILLSLYEARNGILAIDEFEIGIHHSVMEKFWDSINVLSKDLNVQVFVTSHSKECIEAAYKALSQNSSDAFVLHRFYRKDDQIRTEPYYGDKILAAIEDSYEVR